MNPSEPDDVTRPAGTNEPEHGEVTEPVEPAEPAGASEPIEADGVATGESEPAIETSGPAEIVIEEDEPEAREVSESSDPAEPVEPADTVEPTGSHEPIEDTGPIEPVAEPVEVGGAAGAGQPPDVGEPDRTEPADPEPGPTGFTAPDFTEPLFTAPGFTGADLTQPLFTESGPAEPGSHEPRGDEPDLTEPDPGLPANVLFAPEAVFAPDVLTPDPPEPAETFTADQPEVTDAAPTHVVLPAEMTVPVEIFEPAPPPGEPAMPAAPPEVSEPAEVGRASRRRGTRRADRRTHRTSVDMEQVVDFVGYRYATAVLVVLALLALYGVAALSRPDGTARARGAQAPITSVVLGCPAPAGTRLSALAPGAAGAGATGGRADITDTRRGTAINALATAGVAWSQDVRGGREPEAYTVRARDALAAGLEVEQTSAVTKGADRGLAGVRCTEPGTDRWFLGPGPVDAKDIELHLINVDAQPAAVDTLALSGEGPLDTIDGRGTTVAPHSRLVVRIGRSAAGLGELANSARLLALHVRATTGRVSAAVRVRVDKGKGVDWLPLTTAPATDVVVPGIPAGDGRRKLLVAVPGDSDAHIRVQVITAAGAFAPEGQDTLDAPAQTVTPVDLERALSGKPAAVRLLSDRPIMAGFAAQRGADVAYGAATRPLGAGGVVADNRAETSLLLTAPDRAATVRVTAVTAQGAAGNPQDVEIGAGRTVEVRMPAPPGAENGFGVLLTPRTGSGPVHAARVLSMGKGDGRLLTVLPVVPALFSVAQPRVGDSLTSLVP